MTRPQYSLSAPDSGEAGRHYARLRHTLGLVEQIAGRTPAGGTDAGRGNAGAEDPVRVSSAYERAPPIARRRFDTLVSEVSTWAASGVDALASVKDPRSQPRIAAARLADEIERALVEMSRLLRL